MAKRTCGRSDRRSFPTVSAALRQAGDVDVEMRFDVAVDAGPLHGDSNAIRAMLVNLLENSLDACQSYLGTRNGVRGPDGVPGKPVDRKTLLAVLRHLPPPGAEA